MAWLELVNADGEAGAKRKRAGKDKESSDEEKNSKKKKLPTIRKSLMQGMDACLFGAALETEDAEESADDASTIQSAGEVSK